MLNTCQNSNRGQKTSDLLKGIAASTNPTKEMSSLLQRDREASRKRQQRQREKSGQQQESKYANDQENESEATISKERFW